jgi:hypothetical protein
MHTPCISRVTCISQLQRSTFRKTVTSMPNAQNRTGGAIRKQRYTHTCTGRVPDCNSARFHSSIPCCTYAAATPPPSQTQHDVCTQVYKSPIQGAQTQQLPPSWCQQSGHMRQGHPTTAVGISRARARLQQGAHSWLPCPCHPWHSGIAFRGSAAASAAAARKHRQPHSIYLPWQPGRQPTFVEHTGAAPPGSSSSSSSPRVPQPHSQPPNTRPRAATA